MPRLRDVLSGAGMQDVRTYVQSGNVILTSHKAPDAIAAECEALIEEQLKLTVPVVVRTREELAEIVNRNPLGDIAENHKRYQVSFLGAQPDARALERLEALRAGSEAFAAAGRELYAYHPEGVARSKLSAALADQKLLPKATARNWTTVTTMLELADEA